MVLAAGRGERMRPLTDQTPKPLLRVRGQPLMHWPMQALARGGFVQQLINTAWLGEQFPVQMGEHIQWPGVPEVQIRYSHEGQDFGRALETAGGIVRALPQLDEVFWVVAGDVFAPDLVFTQQAVSGFSASTALAHLWLVPNPAHRQPRLRLHLQHRCAVQKSFFFQLRPAPRQPRWLGAGLSALVARDHGPGPSVGRGV